MEKEENMSETVKTIIYAIVIAVLIRSFMSAIFCSFPNILTAIPGTLSPSAFRLLKGVSGAANPSRVTWWCSSFRKTTAPILSSES